ncbi:MAG TPA: hypothetical protein VEY12_10705 [Thermoplasmata archaeon]|nr:hypothetical protein [Thermoplasmata archaeon]
MTEVRVALSEEINRYLDSLVRTGPFASKAELVRAALVSYASEAGPMAQGFDLETRFAPNGRVYQLEYARECARRGSPGVGAVYDGGVLLAATATAGKLVRSIPKIRRIEERLAILASGFVADAYVAAQRARQAKPQSTEDALDLLVSLYWEHSADRTKRPMAAGLLIASALDGDGRLFYLDPSGALIEYEAAAVGDDADERMEALEKRYRKGTARETERLLLDVLGKPPKVELLKVSA